MSSLKPKLSTKSPFFLRISSTIKIGNNFYITNKKQSLIIKCHLCGSQYVMLSDKISILAEYLC